MRFNPKKLLLRRLRFELKNFWLRNLRLRFKLDKFWLWNLRLRFTMCFLNAQLCNLFYSYLHNRQQFISNNQSKSELKLTHCGIPQDSSLGPLFFLIYINDLNFALKSQPRLFADNTFLIVKGLNPEQLQIKINSELQNLHQWYCVNKLSINPSETNIIIIPPKQTNATIPHLHLTSNGFAINIVDSAKYLGVVNDNELNFKQYIKMMEGKVARSVEILFKLKHFFPQNIMLQPYYALVHPFLSYGIIIWGATYPTYIKRLKSLQNRAIRAVARCHYRDEVKLFYNQLKILQIDDLLKYEIAKFVHCNITNKTPNSFRNYFCKITEHSSRVSRQSRIIRIFIFHSTEQINCKGALNIRESRSGIPYLKKLGFPQNTSKSRSGIPYLKNFHTSKNAIL